MRWFFLAAFASAVLIAIVIALIFELSTGQRTSTMGSWVGLPGADGFLKIRFPAPG